MSHADILSNWLEKPSSSTVPLPNIKSVFQTQRQKETKQLAEDLGRVKAGKYSKKDLLDKYTSGMSHQQLMQLAKLFHDIHCGGRKTVSSVKKWTTYLNEKEKRELESYRKVVNENNKKIAELKKQAMLQGYKEYVKIHYPHRFSSDEEFIKFISHLNPDDY